MQLVFEHQQNIGAGTQPAAIHSADNHCQVFFVQDGKIHVMDAETPFGEWADRDFNTPYLACRDEDVQYLKLKYLSGTNIWAVWRNMAEESDEGYQPDYERHRIAVFTLLQNVSNLLARGTLEFNLNNPIVELTLGLKNPGQEVSGEEDSVVIPGANIAVYFRAGNSERYPLGRYFVDRNKMSVTEPVVDIVARNAIGKLLRDQTFDEENSFPKVVWHELIAAILDAFDVPEDKRWISTGTYEAGIEFPPDMNGLDGMMETLKIVRNWQIREDMDGNIGVGFVNDSRFDQPDTYDFQRGTDVWSREVTRADEEAYSRVCVWTREYQEGETTHPAIYVYEDVDARFPLPRKKTLYVEVAQGTTEAAMGEYAEELAERLSQVGVIETFVGPIRPHLQPGDEARIHDVGSRLLGVITTVRHLFGEQGYATEIVVDSGGVVGKSQIRDFIEKIAGRQVSPSQVKRLYS